MRYMKDYAIPYAERSGDLNQVPRAAYAVYNAGPRAVDERLWMLYQGIAAGGRADLRTCDVITGRGIALTLDHLNWNGPKRFSAPGRCTTE